MTERNNKLDKIILTSADDGGWAFDLYKQDISIEDSFVYGYFSMENGEHSNGHQYLHVRLVLFNLERGDVLLGKEYTTQPHHTDDVDKVELPDYYHPDLLEVKQVIQKILDYDNQNIPIEDWDINIGDIQLC